MDTSVDEALSRVEAAAFALIASDPAIRSVGVGYVDEGVGFVAVRSMEGASAFAGRVRRPVVNAFEGVPIRYQSSLEDPRSLARIPIPGPLTARLGNLIDEQQLMRPLACGVQIQNFDDDVRQGVLARGFMSVGSLGCFVRLADGAVALLTNNHVVAGENRGVQGVDRILQAGGMNYVPAEHIATLGDFAGLIVSPPRASPSAGNVALNEVDAGVAPLLPGQPWVQDYLSGRGSSPPAGVSGPVLGDMVHKVGRTTGLTSGKVTQVGVVVGPVRYGAGDCWFRRSFVIDGTGGATFSKPGDSGSSIVRDSDGIVLGLLYAGNSDSTYACPIEPVLDKLKCALA